MANPFVNRIVNYGTKPADQFQANPLNYRTHPERQRKAVQASLRELGWIGVVVENKRTGNLIDGHERVWQALKHNEPVPYIEVDLSEEEERLALATFDPITYMAETDTAILDALLREVNTGEEALQELLASMAEDAGLYQDKKDVDAEPQIDRAAELQAKWGTSLGQLWQLGEHRLVCGDCTDAAVVARLMGGEKAVLMSTDPPYGVDFEGAKYNPRAKAWDGIEGDKIQGNDLKAWLENCLRTWFPHVEEDAAFYLWTAAMEEGAAAAAIRASGLHIQSQIIWNKNTLVLGQADYQWKHENCWYAFWKGKHHRWFGGRAQTTVWDVSKIANSAYVHPMQKPVELYGIAIENHTHPGEICAEPFSGSGTQIIACEQLGRKCRACEISPAYVAVALQRWADATGQTPVLLTD
jgi:DNA modification methylase